MIRPTEYTDSIDGREFDQGFRSRDRRARIDREEARGRRSCPRAVARAVRARCRALEILPRAPRSRRTAHRAAQRARRAQAGAGNARAGRTGPRLIAAADVTGSLADFLALVRTQVDAALER